MSHSYKHTPVYKIKSTYHKRRANKQLRRKSRRNYCETVSRDFGKNGIKENEQEI